MVHRLAGDLGSDAARGLACLALHELRERRLIESDVPVATGSLSRRQWIRRLGAAAIALPVIHSIVAPSALEAASLTRVFGYTGSTENFVVPPGVSLLTIDVYGAAGSGGPGNDGSWS